MNEQQMRTEGDSMGELEVPVHAYYGANTQRARLNFPISELRFNRSFIRAIGQIKLSAAIVNRDLGELPTDIAISIEKAATRVINGDFDDEFVVDIFQTGSGTSTNMNANEVISNVAIKALGGIIGSRNPIHPNDHVNKGQSSNDVIPTAIHLAAACAIKDDLLPAIKELEDALLKKSRSFWPVIKTGRTHLQDATPIRLGQEFMGYAGQMNLGQKRVIVALEELSTLAIGGTAVGTGVGMHPEFAARVIEQLTNLTGLELTETSNHFQAQSTLDGVVTASGALKTVAVSLIKIASDIRWLGSGPRAGIGEIALPEVQPGSSIMPGKVNPVIAESVSMVSAQVIGNDATIVIAGQSGNFELNTMMPVAAYNLLQSIDLLAASSRNFSRQCIEGITATERGPSMVNQGLAICTALAPTIGYDAAAAIAHEASETGETIRLVALRRTDLSETDIDHILDAERMTESG